jgi:hypothetical protein
MALINLVTNLKSLKFGKDRFGGGDSGQPFIKTPIDDDPSGQSLDKDFLLRGGLSTPLRAGLDTERLTRYFTNLKSPSGFLFVAKQNLLSQTAVRTQASLRGPNEGVYTPLSTLAQSLGGYTGLHAFKQGLNPFEGVRTYSDAISPDTPSITPSIVSIENNRLINLYDEHVGRFSSTTLLSYQGGPNSVLGVGFTDIPFATDNRGATLKVLGNDPITPSFIRNQTGLRGSDTDRSKINEEFRLPIGVTEQYRLINGGGISNIGENYTYDSQTGGILARISGENGITWEPTETVSVYKNDGLTPISNIETYQIGLKNSTTDRSKINEEFRLPLGASTQYSNIVGGFVFDEIEGTVDVGTNTGGGLASITSLGTVWQNRFLTSVYSENTLTNTSIIRNNNSFTLNQDQISDQLPSKPNKDNPGSIIQDFRNDLPDNKDSNTVVSVYNNYNDPSKTYEGKNGSRIELTSPGLRGNRRSYTAGKIVNGQVSTTDKLNAQPIYQSKNLNRQLDTNDLVNFRIAAIDSNRTKDNKLDWMHFRAFIDGFSDAYSAEWSAQKYMGRGEPLFKYGGFDRKISLSFTVAAQSKPELMIQYKKLNYLASNLAPYYSDAGYMSGPLVKLTMGGWCYDQPGFITSMTLDVPQESPWEITIDDNGNFDKSVKELPHIVKVSGFSFTPIHTFRPEKQELTFDNNGKLESYGEQRYLSLRSQYSNNYNDVP